MRNQSVYSHRLGRTISRPERRKDQGQDLEAASERVRPRSLLKDFALVLAGD